MSYYCFMDNRLITRNITDFDKDIGAALLKTILIAKGGVPFSHKRTADNYVVIKRMYSSHAVKATISLSEYDLLKRYDFQPLESTTVQRANEELEFLKKWSFSNNYELRKDADMIIVIRAKELKNITASAYSNVPSEMYNGYKAIDKYFEEITKFYR